MMKTRSIEKKLRSTNNLVTKQSNNREKGVKQG